MKDVRIGLTEMSSDEIPPLKVEVTNKDKKEINYSDDYNYVDTLDTEEEIFEDAT